MSKLRLVDLYNKISGLEDIVNTPIQGIMIPSTGEDEVIRSTEEFAFSTLGESLQQILDSGQESILENIQSADLNDEGIVVLNTMLGGNG